MANQPLAFAEMMAGGVLLLAGISGDSIGNVVRGTFTYHGLAGSDTAAAATGSTDTSSSGAASPAQVKQWAKQGLEAAGVPATQSNIDTISGRIMQESSGDPNAINLWDSNAQAGHPSQGLLQTIPSTFETYHVPGTSTSITDPVANVAAAVKYMLAQYGHLVGPGPGGY